MVTVRGPLRSLITQSKLLAANFPREQMLHLQVSNLTTAAFLANAHLSLDPRCSMFEDSLVESQVSHISSGKRWTALASITLQCAVAATLVALPLLHPERLTSRIETLPVFTPLPPKPPVHVEHVQPSTTSSSTSTTISTATRSPLPSLHPTQNPNEAPTTTLIGPGMTDGLPASLSTASNTSGPRISVA